MLTVILRCSPAGRASKDERPRRRKSAINLSASAVVLRGSALCAEHLRMTENSQVASKNGVGFAELVIGPTTNRGLSYCGGKP